MIWSLIGSIGGKVLDIVDDVVEDKDEAKAHFGNSITVDVCRRDIFILFLVCLEQTTETRRPKQKLHPVYSPVILLLIFLNEAK